MYKNPQLAPSIILFFTVALWGVFWLPLRTIEAAGISGVWAVFAINVVPLLFLLPLIVYRRKSLLTDLKTKTIVGIAFGGGMAFYAIAFLYTSILRTTLLFYMSPIWATLLAMFILHEKINISRWIAIATGFAGLLLILSDKSGLAFSTGLNRGDLFALVSGLFWGVGTVVVKKSGEIPAIDLVPGQYLWSTLIALAVLLTTVGNVDFQIPDYQQWVQAMPLVFGFYVLIVLPTIIICTRISQILSPGRVCLLMMSEVLVAGISAPILAGESISAIELIAGLLIIAATVIEVYGGTIETKVKAQP